jgi:hypothetical protein
VDQKAGRTSLVPPLPTLRLRSSPQKLRNLERRDMEILSSSPEKTEKLGMKDMEILSTIYQLFRSVSLDSMAYHSKK